MGNVKKKRSKKYFEQQLVEEKNVVRGLKSQVKILKSDKKRVLAQKDSEIDSLKEENKQLRSVEDRKKLTNKITLLEAEKAAIKSKHIKELKNKKSNDAIQIKRLVSLLQEKDQELKNMVLALKKHNIVL